MTKEQLKEFETRLLDKRRSITATRSGAVHVNTDYGRDEGDRASASQNEELTLLLNSQDRNLLKLVEAALSRIDDGTFGECEHCGRDIAFKRLAAVPWTRYCIACQEFLEEYGGNR